MRIAIMLCIFLAALPVWAGTFGVKTETKAWEPYTPEDLFSAIFYHNPQRLSDDGENLIYISDKSGTFELWQRTPSGEKQLTNLNERVLKPRVSPDRKSVVFYSDKNGDEGFDLFHLNLKSGELIKLTDTEKTAEWQHEFSPDGKKIAYLKDAKTPFQFQLFIMDLETKKETMLTDATLPIQAFSEKNAYETNRGLVWSRDGESIAVFQTEDLSTGDLLIVSSEGKGIKTISPPPGGELIMPHVFSPDNKFLLGTTKDKEHGFLQLCLIDVEKTSIVKLFGPTNNNIGEVLWDEKLGIIFTQNFAGVYGLYRMADIDEEGTIETLLEPEGTITELDLDEGGRSLLFVKNSGIAPTNLFVINLDTKKVKQMTRSLPKNVESKNLSPAHPFTVKSPDGLKVPGFYYLPQDPNIKGPYPAIALAHGGPEILAADEFDPEIQAYCAAGFLVVVPNYRGSTGLGIKHEQANQKDWGGGDLADIKAAMEKFIDEGLADPKRIGMAGASYGGYLSLMAAVKHPDFWKVIGESCGYSDMVYDYNLVKDRFGGWYKENFGTPSEDPELFFDRSPINFFENIKAPIIIHQGEQDTNVPLESSKIVVAALKKLGKIHEFVTFPDEGHCFTRRPNRIARVQGTIEFFLKHLDMKRNDTIQPKAGNPIKEGT